jgi:hypothetical protein
MAKKRRGAQDIEPGRTVNTNFVSEEPLISSNSDNAVFDAVTNALASASNDENVIANESVIRASIAVKAPFDSLIEKEIKLKMIYDTFKDVFDDELRTILQSSAHDIVQHTSTSQIIMFCGLKRAIDGIRRNSQK